MRLNIITEAQARKFAREEIKKTQDALWTQLERLRKRIVELEKKNMDIKKFKGPLEESQMNNHGGDKNVRTKP